MIKVSYIIPLYNKERYILECIDSILEEEGGSVEIEICIVNDGSTDESLNIILDRYQHDKRVKIDSFPKNKGKNAALNRAYQMTTGELVCLFGADDVVVPGRTKKLLEIYDITSPKAIYGGIILKNANLSQEFIRRLLKEQTLYSISMANGLSGGCVMLPKILGNNIFPIPENLRFEDWWIAYCLVKDGNVTILNDYVTYYRIHDSNDCGFYGVNAYEAVKRDYTRHLDYIDMLETISNNKYLSKSKDLRNAFLGNKVEKKLYFDPFDIFSLKILLFSIFGSKFTYRLFDVFMNIIKKTKKA